MTTTYKQATAFLSELGLAGIGHTGDKNYLAHLVAVYRDLQRWGCDEATCLAGLFHSLYGTERFNGFTLPLDQRERVASLIGQRAERLAHANCVMDRASFDALLAQNQGPFVLRNRLTVEPIELSLADYDDLCRIHLCDWLEQVPRCHDWDYRRNAYQAMAARLGGVALQAFQTVYAGERQETI